MNCGVRIDPVAGVAVTVGREGTVASTVKVEVASGPVFPAWSVCATRKV